MSSNWRVKLALMFVLAVWCQDRLTAEPLIKEASGLVRAGESLLIVADDARGQYYEYSLEGLSPQPFYVLDEKPRLKTRQLIDDFLPIDLEGIDVIDDQFVVVISERLNSLLSRGHLLMEYPARFSSVGNRGLEGVAIRQDPENPGRYQIAVVWEGGYLESEDLPDRIDPTAAASSFFPVIISHTLTIAGEDAGELEEISLNTQNLSTWVNQESPRRREPFLFQFRAPDLVWHKDGYIVLLSCTRTPQRDGEALYGAAVLQRFDRHGEPIGDPFVLADALKQAGVPDKYIRKNWEGLAWFAVGRTLMLIYDDRHDDPIVPLIDIPKEWM